MAFFVSILLHPAAALAVIVPPDQNGAFRTDRILMKPKPGASGAAMEALHELAGGSVLRHYPVMNGLQVVQLTRGTSVTSALSLYRNSGLTQYAEPDYILHAARVPNEPNYFNGSQWALFNWGQLGGTSGSDIDAAAGWEHAYDASSIIVSVLDTGTRVTHEDLAANLWINPGEIPGNGLDDDGNGYIDDVHGINAMNGSGDLTDEFGHGTHVAGILGAVGNNGVGIVGVAWRIQIMTCKFLDMELKGSVSDAVECINYSRVNGARIVNASWGGRTSTPFFSNALYDAIDSLREAGILFVAAAGNSALDNDSADAFYPASYDLDNILSVAATTRDDDLAHFSCYGRDSVDLGAPGYIVLSCWSGSDADYRTDDGTSMAAPHVAGACALAWTLYPDDSYQQIVQRVLTGVDPVPALAGKCRTGGRLNLKKVLSPEPIPSALWLQVQSLDTREVRVRVLGAVGARVLIESSSDVVSWAPIATNDIPAGGIVDITDSSTGRLKFYRAAIIP